MDDGTPLAREQRSEAASRASGRLKRFAAVATVLACVGTAVAFYSQQGFALDPRMLRARIEDFGWLAPAVYVVAAALRPFLILPSWVVMSAGGLLFGVWGGIAWGSVGFSLGALLAFSLARALGRDAVSSRLGGRAARIDSYISERGAPWMALYTAVPVTVLTPVHMGAGLSGMTLAAFALAAISGLVPRTALYSFFGDSIAQGEWSRIGVALALIGVTGAGGIVVAQRWGRRRAHREPETQPEEKAEFT
jgi:uncharacterized membrane protein YdjX (TVP38/TMEM64 family)